MHYKHLPDQVRQMWIQQISKVATSERFFIRYLKSVHLKDEELIRRWKDKRTAYTPYT